MEELVILQPCKKCVVDNVPSPECEYCRGNGFVHVKDIMDVLIKKIAENRRQS